MRGNLIWNDNAVTTFIPDENGYWEIVDGKILPYQKNHFNEFTERKMESDKWYENELEKFKKNYSDTPKQQTERKGWTTDYRAKSNAQIKSEEVDYEIIFCKTGTNEILSVKRKSDNAIFQVDEVTEQGKIKEFCLWGNQMMAMCDMSELGAGNVGMRLYELSKKKEKEILFTTDVLMSNPILSINDVVKKLGRYANDERIIIPLLDLVKEKSKS